MEPWALALTGVGITGTLALAMWGINGDHGRYSHIAFALGAVWISGVFTALFAVAVMGMFGAFS